MKFKEYLQKLIKNKRNHMEELQQRSDASQDIDEVRAIGEQLKALRDEITDAEEQLAELDDEGNEGDDGGSGTQNGEGEGRSTLPDGVMVRGFNPMNTYGMSPVGSYPQGTQRNDDPLSSYEYRQAFMKYVQTGEWNYEGRAAAQVNTADIGKVIPNTIMQELIKELKVYGQLYNKVRKLNVQGGVEFPIEELVPTVKWITETTVSEEQKAPEIKTSVSFGYYIAEARIAQSLLSSIVSLPILESEIAKLLAEAFVKEFDNMIVNGTGSGAPTGILNDSRVKAANKIAFTETDFADWTKIRKNFFAKIPLAYRGQGIFIMTVATWESNIMTLKDKNDRPLYTETYDPVTGNQICRFNGREVVLVEPDILKDFDSAVNNDVFAIYLKPTDYAINSNLQIGFKRYFDEDKNKWVNKGLTICDGKLLDVNGVFLLTKKVTSA